MRHPRYCLTHHPDISSNITNATHFSTPPKKPTLAYTPTLPTLAHHPRQPRWQVTHASTQPTLVCHPLYHATNANTSPTLAGLPLKYATYDIHVSTNSMPLLKLLSIQLALRFHEEIQQVLLLVFIYTAFTFQDFLSIFIEV